MKGLAFLASLALCALTVGGAAMAQTIGGPVDGAVSLQPAATGVMEDIHGFHRLLLIIITAISLLVLALLIWVVVRFNRGANPTPRKFTHNLTVEVAWTIIPVIILVVIAGFSFPLLFKMERTPDGTLAEAPAPSLTIKATGNAWYWGYTYYNANGEEIGVDLIANMLADEEARAAGRPLKLATDEPIYVPYGETVHMLITSNDVIHSWTIPSFGIKEDAIPGRVNEGWFNVKGPGVYYGQCSELCGSRHAFMPIEVRAVSRAEFDQWVISKGGTPPAAPVTGAAAERAQSAG